MIDNIAYGIKVVLFVIGVWKLSRGHVTFVAILLIPLFMTGVELITPNSTPWEYLITGGATDSEYQKAIFGGALMIALVAGIYVLVSKNLVSIVDSAETSKCKQKEAVDAPGA